MLRRSSGVISVWLLLSGALATRAQTPPNTPSPQADYAREAIVGELVSQKINFENDGTSVQEETFRARIQSDAGVKQFGLLTFGYQGSTQTVEFDYVRVRKPDGAVVLTPPDNVQDLDAGITRDAPFYSDLREKHVAVKGLSTGDTLEYQVRVRSTKSLAPGQFWFNYNFEHSGIVLDEQLQVSVPRERAVKVKCSLVKAIVSEEGGRRIYTWKTSNLADHSKEDETKKQIDANLGRQPPPDLQISSFQSWDEVGKWYWGLQQERIQPTPEIRAKAAELTKGAADSAGATRTIYDFVSTKFRYIGVAFGLGRYQPHSADDVLGNQYGDCKDKHTLLASLLQAAGVAAYPALISTSHALDPDIPSPAQFDHVISVIPQGKDFIWLDTTTEVGPFGYLLPVLRDKQAMIIGGDKPVVLVRTPADPPFQNFIKFSVDGKLSVEGTMDAKMEYSSRGDDEVLLRSVFRRVPQTQWTELVQRISMGLGFGGTVSDVNVSSPEDTSSPVHFSYAYNRKDYSDWSEHRISMPSMPFSLPTLKEDGAHARDPIWLGSEVHVVSEAKVELPKGYTPEMPEGVTLVRDYAEFHSTYSQDHGVLSSHQDLQIILRQVPDSERDDYKQFVKSAGDEFGRYIVLTSSPAPLIPTVKDPVNDSLVAAFKTLPESSNEEVRKFEKESLSNMGADPPAAVESLKRAVTADPQFTRGWITLGTLYMALSQVDAGVGAFRKAIDSDPKQVVPYRTLATTLVSLHRVDEAIQVWQELLKVAPEDRNAIKSLAELFFMDKRYGEAIPLLESEVEFGPSVEPMSRLSSAYIKSGDIDKGYNMLQSILKLDTGSWAMHNVASELADANAKLPEALDYAKKAVSTEEDTSEKTSLANLTAEDLHTTQRIGTYWDTLGWVQFRLGHIDEAEKYLRASWTLSQQAAPADHLGQLYEQKQRKQDAIHMYRLALWVSTSMEGGANRDEIQAHLSHLVPGEKPVPGMDFLRADSSGDELSQMRRVKLERITPKMAGAEFFLLFGPGAKLEDVKFVSGADELRGAGKFLQAAKILVSFPDESKAHVVRRGIVSCTTIVGCSLVLYTPGFVNSVN